MKNSENYLIQHKLSESEITILFDMESKSKSKIVSTKSLMGNVVSLAGVKTAIEHFHLTYKDIGQSDLIA